MMRFFAKLLGGSSPSLKTLRRDLMQLGHIEFVGKHAGNSTEERMMTVASILCLAKECTPQEKEEIGKALLLLITIESAQGKIFTLSIIGRFVSEKFDCEVLKLIDKVLAKSEQDFGANGRDRDEFFVQVIRLARAGDMDSLTTYAKSHMTHQ